ncbi:MAG: DUF6216 family protein [Arenimonas sp.]
MVVIESLKPLIGSILSLSCLLFAACLAWVIWKTESKHVLKSRAWRMVVGAEATSDEVIKRVIGNQTSMNHFGFIFGINPRTMNQAHALVHWAEERDIDLLLLGQAGKHFDIRKLSIGCPGKITTKLLQTAVFISMSLFFLSVYGLTISEPLLVFRNSDTAFFLSESSVSYFPAWDNRYLTIMDCANRNPLGSAGFNPSEVSIFCDFFATKDARKIVAEKLFEQRVSLLPSIIAFAACLTVFVFLMAENSAARKVTKLLNEYDNNQDNTG